MAGIKVEVRKGYKPEEKDMNFNEAMKVFKRRVQKDGVLQELRKREYYVKPGIKKRLKHEAAVKEQIKREKKRNQYRRDK